MSRPGSAPSVAFIYGFSEGPWHGKRFIKALQKRGFRVISNIAEADIIIAHSGGGFYLDHFGITTGQFILLINPPYWPERSLLRRTLTMTGLFIRSVRPGNHPFYQFYKMLHNFYHLLRYFRTNLRTAWLATYFNLETVVVRPHLSLIRTHQDPWIKPDLDTLAKLNPAILITEISGEHDACWRHPEPYIDILERDLHLLH